MPGALLSGTPPSYGEGVVGTQSLTDDCGKDARSPAGPYGIPEDFGDQGMTLEELALRNTERMQDLKDQKPVREKEDVKVYTADEVKGAEKTGVSSSGLQPGARTPHESQRREVRESHGGGGVRASAWPSSD